MKSPLTTSLIGKSFYSALVFFGTLMVLSAGYATYSLAAETAGAPLTAAKWNAVTAAVNDLDDRVSGVLSAVTALQTSAGNLWSSAGGNISHTGGNVGIGTTTPTQKLSVAGIVESTSGGFKFPDGTTQTTAGAPKAYVRFNGTTCSPNCTINSSYNVSSVSYAGSVYTVNFTNPMSNADYVYSITVNARAPLSSRVSSTIDAPVATANSLSFSISGTANGGNFGWAYTTSDSVNIIIY